MKKLISLAGVMDFLECNAAPRIERLGGYYRPVPSTVVDSRANPA